MKKKLLVLTLVPMLCACSFSAKEYSASQFKKIFDEQIVPKEKTEFVKGDQISYSKHYTMGANVKDTEYSLKTKDYAIWNERFGGEENEKSPLWAEYEGGGISFSSSNVEKIGDVELDNVSSNHALAYEKGEGTIKEMVEIGGKKENTVVGSYESQKWTYLKTSNKATPDEYGEIPDFLDSSTSYSYSERVEKNADGVVTVTTKTWEINIAMDAIAEVYGTGSLSYTESKSSVKMTYTNAVYTAASTGDYQPGEYKIVKSQNSDEHIEGTKTVSADGEVGPLVTTVEDKVTNKLETIETKADGKITGVTWRETEVTNGGDPVVTDYTDSDECPVNEGYLAQAEPKNCFDMWNNDASVGTVCDKLLEVYRAQYDNVRTALNNTSHEKECLIKGDNVVVRSKDGASEMTEYQFDKASGQPTRFTSYVEVDFTKIDAYTQKESAIFTY